jgi:signal transduction histidine kinase
MGTLITDLRALGRYGQTVDGMVELDLDSLVDAAWSNVETGEATLEIDGDLGSINGEEGRVLQLFENLFRNAVDHAGPNVTVRVGSLDDGFYVEDDGPGIPANDREAVFDFGYSTLERGTGIGLAIVEAVAEAHGWELALTDADPYGARFEFRPRWHPDRDGR